MHHLPRAITIFVVTRMYDASLNKREGVTWSKTLRTGMCVSTNMLHTRCEVQTTSDRGLVLIISALTNILHARTSSSNVLTIHSLVQIPPPHTRHTTLRTHSTLTHVHSIDGSARCTQTHTASTQRCIHCSACSHGSLSYAVHQTRS